MNGKHPSVSVSHGIEQVLEVCPDCSFPTIAKHSIFTCVAITAYQRSFIQMEMQGTSVHMKCQGTLAKLIAKCLPGVYKYMVKNRMRIIRMRSSKQPLV